MKQFCWHSSTIMWYENRRYGDDQVLIPSIYRIGTWIADWPDLLFLTHLYYLRLHYIRGQVTITLTETIHGIDILGKYTFKSLCPYAKQG